MSQSQNSQTPAKPSVGLYLKSGMLDRYEYDDVSISDFTMAVEGTCTSMRLRTEL
jgi:hypothetical protein